MDRSKLALQILSIDLRNARSRNRARIKRGALYAKAIDTILTEMTRYTKKLRYEVNRLSKLENREVEAKKIERKSRSIEGQNTRLTGTLGR